MEGFWETYLLHTGVLAGRVDTDRGLWGHTGHTVSSLFLRLSAQRSAAFRFTREGWTGVGW